MRNFLDFLAYVVRRGKFIYIPLIIFLFAFSAVIMFSSNPTIAPFIYALF